MSTFFLAMCIHPHIQRAAQAELDNVIGGERLPTISDREQLPYINALMKEVLRWAPIAPLSELLTDPFLEFHSQPITLLRHPSSSDT